MKRVGKRIRKFINKNKVKMKYTVKGTITKIGEKRELNNGAFVLEYVVKHTAEHGWETLFKLEMYNKAERVEFMDSFLQYNKVGDSVEVEFDVKGREYEGKVYNSLSHWSCKKQEDSVPVVENGSVVDDLPF